MANEEHLAILKKGVGAWNEWREHADIRPDLSFAKLNEANLFGAKLDEANLRGANLGGANLSRADLSWANLGGAGLVGANLRGANLYGVGLMAAELTQADLSEANLSWASLGGAHLGWAHLNRADLGWANLSRADLGGANLSKANLRLANLNGAKLTETDFSEATLGWTVLGDVDLSTAKGLETVRHQGPSTIGVDTIYRSQGKIPEVFLRGAGLPDEFIAYIGSFLHRPIEFYSCFISYSGKDQEFAERLHADLQDKGVRCWFATEDLKIGDKFQERIEESIRWHDKLLLVLSENSIRSPWVEREVQAAFEREYKSNKLVLFPIRLDETVMATTKAWAADIRRTRHIGEFGHWREHNSYKKALERLLRDLKAQTAAPPAQ